MGFQDVAQGQSVHCLDVPVCDVTTHALLGYRDRNSEKDGIVVRNSEVQALWMGGSCVSGAHQIQRVAFDMGGTFDMLCDVEAVQEQQEFIPSRIVDADMEQMEVSSSGRSDRKVEEAFGGQ